MIRRIAAASALTLAVGGVLFGASPAMAIAGGEHGDHIKNHKKSDDDKFSNDANQYCFTVFTPILSDVKGDVDIDNNCDQFVDQENEGDENKIKED
ncbi:hypothetical protein ACQP1W_30850 [Spirillospora sp. CA-255316]